MKLMKYIAKANIVYKDLTDAITSFHNFYFLLCKLKTLRYTEFNEPFCLCWLPLSRFARPGDNSNACNIRLLK